MFLAVPATIFIASSTEYAFKSGNLISAISLNWASVIVPTTSFEALTAPLLTFAYFFYLQAKFAISSREINTPDRVKLYNDIEMAMGDIKPMVEQAENDRIKLANDSHIYDLA